MRGGILTTAKQELVATIRNRYQQSSKEETGRILDKFTVIADLVPFAFRVYPMVASRQTKKRPDPDNIGTFICGATRPTDEH